MLVVTTPAVEGRRVDGRLEIIRHVDQDVRGALAGRRTDQLLDPLADGDGLGLDRDRLRIEAGQVEGPLPASAFAGSAILSPEELTELETLLNAEEPEQ